ncbi:DnaB-like helicase C-terminal domain-containing protein (plasmid) [Achromobacter anxifer]
MSFTFATAGTEATSTNGTVRPAASPSPKVSTTFVAAAAQASTVLPADAMVDPLSSPDAEFEVCSWLLRLSLEDLDQGVRVLERLADTDVSLSLHRCIVEAARYFVTRNQVCGASAVLDYAVTKGLDVGGADYLARAVSDPICLAADLDRIHQDVEIILDYAARRRTRSMLQDRLNDLSTKSMREVVRTRGRRRGASGGLECRLNEPKHISEVMTEVLEDAFGENVESAPIPTGFPDLDLRLNGGLRDQELILVGGRPGMGKTAFKWGMARNMSLDTSHRRNVLVFSLEMTGKSLGSRILSAESAVPAKILRSGMAGSDEAYLNALHQVLPRFAGLDGTEDCPNSRLWIDDTPGLSLQEIRSRSRAFARKSVAR